ncbi:MAG TPA: 4Fe-4S ferredoxin [Clostridiales bacterium]|nr:4Fe-4S ferredoxin [Clostridiales bacterium]
MPSPDRLKNNNRRRKGVQLLALAAGNAWLPGFFRGTIYQGPLKQICLPGLNCYSCPGALGACPLGSLQNAIADPIQQISFYVLGFLVLTGGLLGRFVCGWLCPFGLFQELLHKIPLRKWRPERKLPLARQLSYSKYIFFGVFIVLIPWLVRLSAGYGEPAFCKYICPSGTLMAGLPLLAANSQLRQLVGWLFGWKFLLLVLTVYLSIRIYRPFCKYVCPLGAFYGLFNRVSLYRVTVDASRCNSCGQCTRVCPMNVPVPQDANSPECIRCGKCAAVCPQDAIRCGIRRSGEVNAPLTGIYRRKP